MLLKPPHTPHAARRVHFLFSLVLLALPCVAFAQPATVVEVRVAPDGKVAAILRDDGRLGITTLGGAGRLWIVSRAAQPGLAFASDGKLAWVEREPGKPAALCIAQWQTGDGGPRRRVLLSDADTKQEPVWLTSTTLAYLSDRAGADMNLWRIETTGVGPPGQLLDFESDLAHIWPAGEGRLLFSAYRSGEPVLYELQPGAPPRPISNSAGPPLLRAQCAISADARRIAYLATDSQRVPGACKVVLCDAALNQLASLPVDAPVLSLAVLGAGGDARVLINLEREALLWDAHPGWFEPRLRRLGYAGLTLGPMAAWGEEGVALALNGHVLLLARAATTLEAGELNVGEDWEWLLLARALHDAGKTHSALNMASNLWSGDYAPAVRFAGAAARSRMERLRNHPYAAERWIQRALEVNRVGAQLRAQAEAEQFALRVFERNEWPSEMETAPSSGPLQAWLVRLEASTGTLERRSWRYAARGLRKGDYPAAALALWPAFAADPLTSATLDGLELLLDGAFEPLGHADGADQRYLEGMLRQPPYQRCLWRASQWYAAHPAPGREGRATDMLGLLLQQWAGEGDLGSARELLRRDLARPEGPLLNYPDFCLQFLVVEEFAGWIRRLVDEVLFEPELASKIEARFASPDDALAIRLAWIKHELLAGNADQARRRLLETRIALGQLDNTASATLNLAAVVRKAVAVAPTGNPAAQQADFLLDLFTAKTAELLGEFDSAAAAYQACLLRMEGNPGNWDANAFEIVRQLALLRAGARDPADLTSYLRVQRGMGDPLLSPSRDPGTLEIAANNLNTLLRFNPPDWLRPHLLASLGVCASMRGEHLLALEHLRAAEALKPDAGLLQRLLLEQAAARDALDQSALAARLYARIASIDVLPASARAAALLAQAQSEVAAGLGEDAAARAQSLPAAAKLPPAWQDWLRLQAGGGDAF